MNVKAVVENQNMIYNIFKQANQNHRLSHAYLFYGEPGTGKKEMAYALACMMYCPHGGCLECETCKSILENNHMNVDYIGIEDNKTMISKDQITALQDEFSKTSLVEGTRIYIVDGIDTASSAAQNSLLKFIEDPTNQTPTIGIFLATEMTNVVSTIVSRCVLQHFQAIPLKKAIDILKSEGVEELDAILAASLTNDVDEAKELSKSQDFLTVKELFLELIDIDIPKNAIVYFIKNQTIFANSKMLSILLEWCLLYIEDCNLLQSDSESLILTPLCDKINTYRDRNKDCLRDKLKFILDLFNKLKYNVSAKNVFHELIINFI